MAEDFEIDWHRTEHLVLGFCSGRGTQGLWRFWLGSSGDWEYFPYDTEKWNYYHQMIYWSQGGDACKFSDIVDQVPSLPAEYPPPDKYHVKDPVEDRVISSDDLLVKDYLLEEIGEAPDERLPVYVVLEEDPYETSFGDGIFRDFNSAHLDEEEAKAHIQFLLRKPPRMTIESNDPTETRSIPARHYIRKVYLTLSGGTLTLDTKDCDCSPYDYFKIGQIATDLERILDPLSVWPT